MGPLQVLAALSGIAASLVGLGLGAGALASLAISLRVGGRFPPAGPFVEVPGGRIAAIEAGPQAGARATVVLVHGASGNAADLMESIGRPLAADGFRVVSLDRPGLGWSDRIGGAEAATPKAQAAILAAVLARMGIGRAILLGHSLGGAVVLAMALDYPERVSGLVLVSPVARPLPADERALPWYGRLAVAPPVAWLLSRTLGPPAGLHLLDGAERAAFAPQPPAEGYLDRSRAALVLRPATMLANVQDLVALPAALAEQAPRYPTLTVPTVIVAGDADPIVRTPNQGRPLAQEIPGARFVGVPGAGHMVPWVATGLLAAEVERLAAATAAPPAERAAAP